MHFTESCDPEAPRLITNIQTTPATTADDNMVEVVHRSLKRRNLLPSEHLVDKGYTDAKVLVGSRREHGVEIIGPVAQDPSWQARDEAGFDKSAFAIDWERKIVSCPAGKESISLPAKYLPKAWNCLRGTLRTARLHTLCVSPKMGHHTKRQKSYAKPSG